MNNCVRVCVCVCKFFYFKLNILHGIKVVWLRIVSLYFSQTNAIGQGVICEWVTSHIMFVLRYYNIW
jgi:hypothetical protein